MIRTIDNVEIKQQISAKLLEVGAIKLNLATPFKWSSGWNSPIYCDNRLALSYPQIRTFIKEQLAVQIKMNFPKVEAIAGVATAGIPQGALVADALDLPFIYVRAKAKGHGMGNMIEGKITKGQKVVLVEDLVSTGGSSLKAAEALLAADFEVLGMLAIFTYGFEVAANNFERENIELICLSDYTTLIDLSLADGKITQEEVAMLKSWRSDPANWNV